MGGGLVGCDEAIYLAMQGKEVSVVEMLGDYARDANYSIKLALGIEFRKYKIKVVTNTRGKSVVDEGLLCTGPDGKDVLCKADTVVCAVGQKALTDVVDGLRNTIEEFYSIGDCTTPAKILQATGAGYDAAMDL